MGFSVSGATALLLVAAFISLGIFSSAAINGFERMNDAYHSDVDRTLDQQNTAVAFGNVTCDAAVDFTVRNTGTTSLSVNDTDVLIDNVYRSGSNFAISEVDGDDTTDLWLPGETLHVNASITNASRVKVVTGPGVAVAEGC